MVPAGNIIVIIIGIILGLAAIILPPLFLVKKRHSSMRTFFYGILVYSLTNIILVNFIGNLLIKYTSIGAILSDETSPWYYSVIFIAVLSSILEETGRLILFKKSFITQKVDDNEAIMYGTGHIGIGIFYSFIIVMVKTLIVLFVINSGDYSSLTTNVSLEEANAIEEQIVKLTNASSVYYLGVLIAWLLSFAYQIALSVIVWFSDKLQKLEWFMCAIIAHFIASFLILGINSGIDMSEGVRGGFLIGAIAFTGLVSYAAYYVFKKNHVAKEIY